MRSHPYTPPPPLPPLLTELTSYLPHRDRDRRAGAAEVALSDLDPETSRLLPPRRRQLRVRVQGRLAPVRSVSVVNPRSAYASTSDHHRVGGPPPRDDAVGCSIPRARARRRYSEDDGRSEDGDGDVGEDGEGDGDGDGDGGDEEKDTQLRGYGIGGAGNIRRPTDVIGTSSRTSSLSLSALFSGSGSTTPSASGMDKRWTLSGLLSRIEDRKGKERGF